MPTFTIKLSDLIQEDFDFGMGPEDYPIFDESYRAGLNQKILRHYWNYEIGQETEEMFKFSLNRKLNEIMPYYNQLYMSLRIQFDPLQTVNYTDFTNTSSSDSGTSHNASSTNSTTDSKGRVVNSTTPQVLLSPNEDYASGATNSITNTEGDTTGTGDSTFDNTNTSSVERTIQGSQGPSAAELLMRFRDTFLNIDMMVIDELNELFMQIWDNGDEFSHSEGIYFYGPAFGFFGIF